MTKKPHVTIHRKDYSAPAYWVNTVEMSFGTIGVTEPSHAIGVTRIIRDSPRLPQPITLDL